MVQGLGLCLPVLGVWFDAWSGSWDPTCLLAKKKKKKENRGNVVTSSMKTFYIKENLVKRKKETEGFSYIKDHKYQFLFLI